MREALTEGLTGINNGVERAHGPIIYYLQVADMLFERFCPWKVGDRVTLIRAVDFTNAPGWMESRHWLTPGAQGTVRAVGARDGLFTAGVVFDDESWIDGDGVVHPVTDRGQYWFTERWLSPPNGAS